MNTEEIMSLIREYLEEHRDFLNIRPDVQLTNDTVLYGKDGILDSLHLIHLVVEVERKVRNKGYPNLQLVDPKAFSFHQSPFRSIQIFSTYISERLQ